MILAVSNLSEVPNWTVFAETAVRMLAAALLASNARIVDAKTRPFRRPPKGGICPGIGRRDLRSTAKQLPSDPAPSRSISVNFSPILRAVCHSLG